MFDEFECEMSVLRLIDSSAELTNIHSVDRQQALTRLFVNLIIWANVKINALNMGNIDISLMRSASYLSCR